MADQLSDVELIALYVGFSGTSEDKLYVPTEADRDQLVNLVRNGQTPHRRIDIESKEKFPEKHQ